jgi:hypothetical protein
MNKIELAIFKSFGISEQEINSCVIDIYNSVKDAYLNNAGAFMEVNKYLKLDIKELYNMDKEKAFYKVSDNLINYYDSISVSLMSDMLGSDVYMQVISKYREIKLKKKINNF